MYSLYVQLLGKLSETFTLFLSEPVSASLFKPTLLLLIFG